MTTDDNDKHKIHKDILKAFDEKLREKGIKAKYEANPEQYDDFFKDLAVKVVKAVRNTLNEGMYFPESKVHGINAHYLEMILGVMVFQIMDEFTDSYPDKLKYYMLNDMIHEHFSSLNVFLKHMENKYKNR